MILVFWYALIMPQNVNVSKKENYFVYLFYLAPLLRIPAWIKMTRIAINGERLTFNKESNEFIVKGKIETTIDAIKRIEINYELREDVNLCFLDLRFCDRTKYQIEHSDAYWDEEIKDAGNKISRFLEVDLVNNHPYKVKIIEPATNQKKY